MEFILRCNDLKCRTQLPDQAVVTTCSHIFCLQCADSTGLSRASNAQRQCPACGTALTNPDDAVVTGLNPTEDYRTSILSGLSPTVLMECASRALGFYTYQSSQEIIYQEHIAKSLTDKYANLDQQFNQLVHEANAKITQLQDKLGDKEAENNDLKDKNEELIRAFGEKSRAHKQTQNAYRQLRAQFEMKNVANAAGDEVENVLRTVRHDRYVDKPPGIRTGTGDFSQPHDGHRQGGRPNYHNRADSRSSGNSNEHPQAGGVRVGRSYGLVGRGFTGQSAPTPSQQQHRSRLPVMNSACGSQYLGPDTSQNYQPSPGSQRPAVGVGPRIPGGGFGFNPKSARKR